MGNLFQCLFSNSREKGHKKANNGNNNSGSFISNNNSEPVQTKRFIKSPSVHPIHNVDDKSTTNQLESPVTTILSNQHEEQSTSLQAQQNNITNSPFQRDFLPPHQVLTSLEKERPRRSNVRRSVRKNTSFSKEDKPPSSGHVQSFETLHSFVETDDYERENKLNEIIGQPDHIDIENAVDQNEQSENTGNVDELSPNERQKVAKSRISQMFIKRQQQKHQQQPTKASTSNNDENDLVEPNDPQSTNLSSPLINGFMLNVDYERVYKNIDPYSSNTGTNTDELNVANEVIDLTNNNHNELIDEAIKNPNNEVSEQSEQSFKPEAAPRRKQNVLGNSMLIDELKKRQSMFYQADE